MSAKQKAIKKYYTNLKKEEKEIKRQEKLKNDLIKEAFRAFPLISREHGRGTYKNPIGLNFIK